MTLDVNLKNVSRRSFLRGGRLKPGVAVELPNLPWALPEKVISDCSRCNKCSDACPENIIVRNTDGFPTVDFSKGDCTFCAECAQICPEPVFSFTAGEYQKAWDLKAVIGADCLAKNGVQCQSCQDHCDVQAIRFPYVKSAIPTPTIVFKDCTGCGACVSICPSSSITVSRHIESHSPKGSSL